jgi:hypothetical protein
MRTALQATSQPAWRGLFQSDVQLSQLTIFAATLSEAGSDLPGRLKLAHRITHSRESWWPACQTRDAVATCRHRRDSLHQ